MVTPSISDPDGICLTVLPKSQVIGLSFTTLAGFISAFAVLIFLGLVVRNFIRNVRSPPPGGEWRLIRTHVDAYLLSLLSSEILQGLGAIMDAKWVHEGSVYCSDYCTAQGAIQVIGETGVAMATLAITLHTFFVIFFRWTPGPRSVWIYRIIISLIWTYTTLFVAIAYSKHRAYNPSDPDIFFSPTPYWCWISSGFDAERIAGEYFWLWTATLSSIFFYTLLFFRLRGNIQVDPQDWKRIRVRLHLRTHVPHDAPSFLDAPFTPACREAMTMIWYPICYTILVLPLSIVRWRTFRPPGQEQPETPFVVTAVVVTVFGLSGVVNVVLVMLTRPNLLLFGQRRGVVSTQESRNVNVGTIGSGFPFAGHSGMFAQGQGSTSATGGRAPTTSVGSTTLPGTSLSRNGDFLDLKSILGAGPNWENTSTHHAPSIGAHSMASLRNLSEPMKFGATPAPAPALLGTVSSYSTRQRKPLPDFEPEKRPSRSSSRALRSSDERELDRSLSNTGKANSTSVGMERRPSLELEDLGKAKSAFLSSSVNPPGLTTRVDGGLNPSTREAQVQGSTSQSTNLVDQEERSRKLSHQLVPAPSLPRRSSYSSSHPHLVPPSGPPPVPPIPPVPPFPTSPPPRPS